MKGRLGILAAIAGIAMLCAQPAQAALELCNKTSYVLYAAAGYQTGDQTITQGWTRIAPGGCSIAIKQKLSAKRYHVYAKSALAHMGAARAWGGNVPLCVREGQFALKYKTGAPCKDDGFAMPFAAIDTRGAANWTMTFNDSPAFKSLMEAQLAGVKRLLRDNGAKIAKIDGRTDKTLQGPLNEFRKRMRLSNQATNEDLFDAMETEALKVTAPAGYTVCNDTDELVWIAMASGSGKNLTTRGWWKAGAGACAKIITEALRGDKIWLLVEKKGGQALVTGMTRLCVSTDEFEIKGQGRCKDRGLSERGFIETPIKGLSGYIARIDQDGLIPVKPQNANR